MCWLSTALPPAHERDGVLEFAAHAQAVTRCGNRQIDRLGRVAPRPADGDDPERAVDDDGVVHRAFDRSIVGQQAHAQKPPSARAASSSSLIRGSSLRFALVITTPPPPFIEEAVLQGGVGNHDADAVGARADAFREHR
jgi:hypothetical protein